MHFHQILGFIIALFSPHTTVASKINLPSYPLAVKSPYLSTWLPSTGIDNVATAQPQFWNGQDLTWPILARIDGKTYALLNSPAGLTGGQGGISAAMTVNVSFSSTRTLFKLAADGVNFTLDFFSPVYPKNYSLQSLPYSYLTVNATSSSPRRIQIFSAIDQTWTAQNGQSDINYATTCKTGFFQLHNPNETPFTEIDDQATWGTVVFGTSADANITHAANAANTVYKAFLNHGNLASVNSTASGTNLAAISKDLGDVDSDGACVTFAVGFQRDSAIDYLGEVQTGVHRALWPEIPDAFDFFIGNYDNAYAASLAFDSTVRSRAESVSGDFGSQYADILEASVRQTFAAYELTVPDNDRTAAPWAFLKEISSDGNTNTIDLIFQTWPIFISLNPEWIKWQLQPVLSYLACGRWPKKYVIHDIGTHYPNATGHDDGNEESMPLFETSSMFILLYTYQLFSNDTSLTAEYAHLLPGWAEYLVENSLYPSSQLISVDAIPATPNQTALAIQSAIGLNAASKLLQNTSYADTAHSFAKTIYNDALGLNGATVNESAHFTYNYGGSETWNVLFASYSDVLLNLTTFPQTAWDLQSDWYLSQIQDAGLAFAGPVSDRGVDWALTDWNFMIASVSSTELQGKIVQSTWEFLGNGMNSVPFGTKYLVEGDERGKWIANKARSTVGAHFALVALRQGAWDW
ncbi:related to glutaminase A [Ramularia collo-cygni]|uniref:Related to glutaminase A n=1 Tax=Ramularia collo-cygni TaxID=112498 RepID=A0A2D3UP95_9PEZI|nr:related to glutaminase A [Ramularia collo-cygni]CZT15638.1 related to glutaminase A [Ramularia collo-cygni]